MLIGFALTVVVLLAKHFHELTQPLPHCMITLHDASNYFAPVCQLC